MRNVLLEYEHYIFGGVENRNGGVLNTLIKNRSTKGKIANVCMSGHT